MLKITANIYKTKNPSSCDEGFLKNLKRVQIKERRSTICAGGLNYSVRDGKR